MGLDFNVGGGPAGSTGGGLTGSKPGRTLRRSLAASRLIR